MDDDSDEELVRLNDSLVHLYQENRYSEAAEVGERLRVLARTVIEDTDPGFAAIVNNLGTVYEAAGDLEAALLCYQEAVAICRNAGALEDVPALLGNLGGVYEVLGNYGQAEHLYQEALKAVRATPNAPGSELAACLNNLALLYYRIGNYTSAERLYNEALQSYGPDHQEGSLEYALALNNLAGLYEATERFDQAEPLYQRALAIIRAIAGQHDPAVALAMNNLAFLYDSMGNYHDAEQLYERALHIRQAVLGERHPDVADSLTNLAELYQARGDLSAAAPLLKQALDIRAQAYGDGHPLVAQSLYNLAALHAGQGNETEALRLMKQAADIDGRMIGHVSAISSERQRLSYLEMLRGRLFGFLSLVLQSFLDSDQARGEAFDLVLQRKAFGIEALSVQREALLSRRYPDLEHSFRELHGLRAQIARTVLDSPERGDGEFDREELQRRIDQRDQLEADLARQVPELDLQQHLRSANRQMIADALPEKSALVELVRFDIHDFSAAPARGDQRWQPAHYVAFILSASNPESVEVIDLGEAERIDQMINDYRAAITGVHNSPDARDEAPSSPPDDVHHERAVVESVRGAIIGAARDLGGEPESVPGSRTMVTGIALRRAIFDPLLSS